MLEKFQFKCAYARRIPDPNFKKKYGMENYAFLMRCKDVPEGIGTEPNARNPNIKKLTYQKVAESLLEEDGDDRGTFHLKNKGITIIADAVRTKGNDQYEITLDSSAHGIVDGGHTYAIIQANKADIPDDQYVRVDIRVGVVEQTWIPMISRGLNTAVQVQEMSLKNLGTSFNWLKQTLKAKHELIAWTENEAGKHMDARDLIAIMCLLNPILFPNSTSQNPMIAYTSKEKALSLFTNNEAAFRAMQPILLQVLKLHDTISFTARDVWNKTEDKTKAGGLKIFEKRKRGKHNFPFIGEESEYKLVKPALYPILAAFRRFVKRDELTAIGKLEWIVEFDEILAFWEEEGRDMLVLAHETSKTLGYVLNALGKNSNLWTTLHANTGVKLYERGLLVAPQPAQEKVPAA